MKTEKELDESISEEWLESEKEIHLKYSQLINDNKKIHAKPLAGLIDFNDKERAFWETINLLDQLSIEAMKEKTLTISCLTTLFKVWCDNYDQPAMRNVSTKWIEQEFANELKSSHAETSIIDVINNLRQLVLLSVADRKKRS